MRSNLPKKGISGQKWKKWTSALSFAYSNKQSLANFDLLDLICPKKVLPVKNGKIALWHASMAVTYYIKLFHTGANRHNDVLMSLLLLVGEIIKSKNAAKLFFTLTWKLIPVVQLFCWRICIDIVMKVHHLRDEVMDDLRHKNCKQWDEKNEEIQETVSHWFTTIYYNFMFLPLFLKDQLYSL